MIARLGRRSTLVVGSVGLVGAVVAVAAFATGQPVLGALVLLVVVGIGLQVWNRMLVRAVSAGLNRSHGEIKALSRAIESSTATLSQQLRAAESRHAGEFAWLSQRVHFLSEAQEPLKAVVDTSTRVDGAVARVEKGLADLAPVRAELQKLSALPHDVSRLASAVQQIRRGDAALPLRTNLLSDASAMAVLYSDQRADRPALSTWTLAPQVLLEVLRRLDDPAVSIVMELGSGVSTVWIARELRRLGRGRLISVEHEELYFEQTRTMLADAGLSDLVDLRLCPLRPVVLGGESYDWYSVDVQDLPVIDLLLVDGPPSSVGPLSRFPALPVIGPRLAQDGLVILDDAVRADEREIVSRWTEKDAALPLVLERQVDRAVVLRRGGSAR